jgi:hypothetical protein
MKELVAWPKAEVVQTAAATSKTDLEGYGVIEAPREVLQTVSNRRSETLPGDDALKADVDRMCSKTADLPRSAHLFRW